MKTLKEILEELDVFDLDDREINKIKQFVSNSIKEVLGEIRLLEKNPNSDLGYNEAVFELDDTIKRFLDIECIKCWKHITKTDKKYRNGLCLDCYIACGKEIREW